MLLVKILQPVEYFINISLILEFNMKTEIKCQQQGKVVVVLLTTDMSLSHSAISTIGLYLIKELNTKLNSD